MGLIVNTNIASLNAQRNVSVNSSNLAKSLERLSSGLRINRAADDAAGLAIANKLRSQVLGLDQARRNANDGISLIQTGEGALNVTVGILNRLKELAVQSASETVTSSDRTALKKESDQLVAELTRISEATEFNGMALLDGTFSAKKLQIGANADQNISITLSDSRAKAMGNFASTTANVGDGASQGVSGSGGINAGTLTINGTNVVATSDSDDQVSVLAIGGASGASTDLLNGGGLAASVADHVLLNINGTSIAITAFATAYASVGSFVMDLASAINAANITNVTARAFAFSGASTALVLDARNGANLALYVSTTGGADIGGTSFISELGLSAAFLGLNSGAAVTTYNGQSSAIAKAAAINAIKTTTGVSAVVEENSMTGVNTIAAGSIASGDLFINGVNIGAVTVQANDANGALASAINAQSSNTGVVASVSGGQLTLKAASGRNITIEATDAAQDILDATDKFGTANYTGATTIIRSSMTLKSTDNFTLSGTMTGIGATAGTQVASGNLATMDMSTRSGANNAITQIESALKSVNSMRADIGATQNRMEMLIQNLMTASENQSAAESRIRDADFAHETAQFTRNQILMQAGTSILAQANTSSQVALQLLR